jgi:hypothetical protein
LVHDSQDETFYRRYPEQVVAAGIYTFPEYYRTERGRKEWKETITNHMETSLDEYAPNLNPMLNIGLKKPSVVILRATAIFGILLHTATFEEVDRHGRDGMSHLVTRPGKIW